LRAQLPAFTPSRDSGKSYRGFVKLYHGGKAKWGVQGLLGLAPAIFQSGNNLAA
jgi:hypothetical protein